MISISTTTKNVDGNVIIKSNADYRDNKARLSRVRTLDGAVIVNHFGVSDGDITLLIEARLGESACAKLWDIFNNSIRVLVSIQDGLFVAAIKSLRIENGLVRMTIFIEEKEN